MEDGCVVLVTVRVCLGDIVGIDVNSDVDSVVRGTVLAGNIIGEAVDMVEGIEVC